MTAQDSLKIFQNLVAQYGIGDPHLISRHMKAVSMANHSDFSQNLAVTAGQPSIMGGNTQNTPPASASNEPLGAGGLPPSPGNEMPGNGLEMA